VVEQWYASETRNEYIDKLEQQVLLVIENSKVDERFTNFVVIAEQFSPLNYETVKLAYLEFEHKRLFKWIDESSYKDAQVAFEYYIGSAFYEVATNYAEKGMADDVQRVIELHKSYPVVEEYASFEVGMREHYISEIAAETEKQLKRYEENQMSSLSEDQNESGDTTGVEDDDNQQEAPTKNQSSEMVTPDQNNVEVVSDQKTFSLTDVPM
jgi:hypothetical protein